VTRIRAGVALSLVALWMTTPARGDDALPVAVPPSHPYLGYVGRFTPDHKSAWNNSTVSVHVKARAVNAVLSGNKVHYVAVVDGGEPVKFRLEGGRKVYRIANDLPAGEHTVELVRVNESFFGTVTFRGLQLSAGGRVVKQPKRPARRIQVIGDSISAGYGNECERPADGFSAETENAYETYGPMAARELHADCVVLAWSGKGLYRNRGKGDRLKDVMPDYYDRTIAMDANSRWDHAKYVPDVVVVNLGTNDCDGGAPPADGFVAATKRFVARIRAVAPRAHVFLAGGPMLGGDKLKAVRANFERAIAEMRDPRVHYLDFAGLMAWPHDCGGHYHPKVQSHRKMAAKLVGEIRRYLKW